MATATPTGRAFPRLDAQRVLLAAQRLRHQRETRYCMDGSVFSALNIDLPGRRGAAAVTSVPARKLLLPPGWLPFERNSTQGSGSSEEIEILALEPEVLPSLDEVVQEVEASAPQLWAGSFVDVRRQLLAHRWAAGLSQPTPSVCMGLRAEAVGGDGRAGRPVPPALDLPSPHPVSQPQLQQLQQFQPLQQLQLLQQLQHQYHHQQRQFLHLQQLQQLQQQPQLEPQQQQGGGFQLGTPCEASRAGSGTPAPRPARTAISWCPATGLRRTVQALLNKVCPENLESIAEKLAAVEIDSTEQLEIVIELIFKKAMAETHYCETYADLVFRLKAVFPEFPSPGGGRPITFRSTVLNICQSEFEELITFIQGGEAGGAEDAEDIRRRQRDRMCANMKFIGHLFLRQLLSAKVISSVSRELVLCDRGDVPPEEHAVECACELLMAVGFTLDAQPSGQVVLQTICSRLLELKKMRTPKDQPMYTKRVQFMVQDLLDTRAAGWTKKSFKNSAKTKEEIRLHQAQELRAKSHGLDTPSGEHVLAGQRPVYCLSP